MKHIRYQLSSTKTSAMFLTAIAILTFSSQGVFAQSKDFFSNTQSDNQRATALTQTAPGFDPCRGGTATSTSCTRGAGVLDANAPLLDPIHLGNTTTQTAGLFGKLGPGAVTDNMFGIIEHPADPLACGAQQAGLLAGGVGSLNCGDGKFDVATQGQTIPPDGLNLTTAMATNTPIDMTSCAKADPDSVTSCTAAPGDPSMHRSQMENAFVWNPDTANAKALPVNLANMVSIVSPLSADSCAAATTPNIRVCGQFSMNETTALGATTTMIVGQSASWTTQNDTTGGMLGSPVVRWESRIQQSEFVGGGNFNQVISGSFAYDTGITFAAAATQYPNGESFTIRAGGGGTPVEQIP
jgi:hypothetical protein